MLIELLSPANHVSYNIRLAQILGLESAIYISQLLDINDKAVRKNKMIENYFVVDRKYIQERTTLSRDKQITIEANLEKIGVISRNKDIKNGVSLDVTSLTSIMMTPDEDLLKDISSVTKSREAKAQAKSAKIEENLKAHIVTTNIELREAYERWIGAVLEKDGWMTTSAVDVAQSTIDKFSNRDLDVALRILEIASVNGYRDVTWAINQFNRDSRTVSSTPPEYAIPIRNTPSVSQDVVHKPRTSDEVF